MSDADNHMKKFEREYREDMARARLVDAAAAAEKEARYARAELRDRFAVEALKTLMPHAEAPNPVTARKAWQWADMMIATREKGTSAATEVSIHPYESTPPPRCPTCFAPAPYPSLINPAVPTRANTEQQARAELRDRFAEMAMEKLMDTSGLDESTRIALGRLPYGLADGMMKAREENAQ